MRILLTVMADILILLAAALAVHEFSCLRRFDSFVVPFTDKLIANGALPKEKRERVLREDRLSHVIGLALCAALWVLLARIFAGISGWIAFPVGFVAMLAAVRREDGETPENRAQYYNAHKNDIDPIKYSAIFEENGK